MASDKEVEPVIRYLNRFLHDLWKRTGGGADFFLAIQAQINVINIRLDLIEDDIVDINAEILAIKVRLDAIELRLDIIEADTSDRRYALLVG